MKFFLLAIICLAFGINENYAQGGADGLGGKKTAPKTSPAKETNAKPTAKSTASTPKSKPVSIAIKADSPGSIFRETFVGQTLVVAYNEEAGYLNFTIEAVTDFTNTSSKYSYDSIELYLDSNKNNQIDCKDVGYFANDKSEVDGIYFSMGCGDDKFKSDATAKYSFMKTANELRPHPGWILRIPKAELGDRSGIINVRFEYSDGGKSYGDCNGGDCKVRIPKYDWANSGGFHFGPVKKLRYSR